MSDTTTIRAVIADPPGGPDALRLVDRELPAPGPGEVAIEVRAAGVNRPDVMQRQGMYPPPPGASDVLGLEVAGTIAALGEGATRFSVGDRVMALLPGGGYASRANADEGSVLPIPDGLPDEAAAGFPETAFTVWTNVFEAGALTQGERLLVHGATSGIGTMAGMMASAMGAEVWGTAGSAEKCCAALVDGYTRCLNYKEADWAKEYEAAGGVDVVLDMVGGDYLRKNVSLLREGGRHVSIALLRGPVGEVDIFSVMRRRLVLTGSTLRARPAEEKARLAGEIERHVLPLVAKGQVKPIVDSTFPLEEARAAHERMESSSHVGKIVLTL